MHTGTMMEHGAAPWNHHSIFHEPLACQQAQGTKQAARAAGRAAMGWQAAASWRYHGILP